MQTFLNLVKLSLRISTNAFDTELTSLIKSALADLELGGIVPEVLDVSTLPDIVKTAVITYVKLHFGEPSDPERLEKAYIAQKAMLGTATGFTEWGH